MIAFRDAVHADAGELALLLDQLGYPTEPADVPARLDRLSASGGVGILAVEVDEKNGVERRIVGFAVLNRLQFMTRERPVGWLSSFVVLDGLRGQGIGALLLAEVERRAAAWGCESVELTSNDRREGAHRFYIQNGYVSKSRKFAKSLPVNGETND
jgi:GNAT superfamily N-acetyltransferase